MKIMDQILLQNSDLNLGYAVRSAALTGMVAAKFQTELEKFATLHPDASITVSGTGIELQGGEREQLRDFLLAFGGNWNKEVEEYYPDKMRYVKIIPHPFVDSSELQIAARQLTPPPACKIVEYEVVVPETIVKKKRIECPKDDNLPETLTPLSVVETELA